MGLYFLSSSFFSEQGVTFLAIYSCSQKKITRCSLRRGISLGLALQLVHAVTIVPHRNLPESVHVNKTLADNRRNCVRVHLTAEIRSSKAFYRNRRQYQSAQVFLAQGWAGLALQLIQALSGMGFTRLGKRCLRVAPRKFFGSRGREAIWV